MRRLLVLAAAAFVLAGCASPAWDEHDYELKAQESAKSVASTLEIVRLAVRDEHRLVTPYLKTLLTEAAKDVGGVNAQFGAVQPPTGRSDELRERLLDLTEQAEDEVDELLIQVRRDGIEDPARAVRQLDDLARKLQAMA
ncbi:hypothetical protein ACIBG8_03895 [Nonomuraea sp. NPDC050556]|uniref:hypothetical protein n=1 Tax=Nonomuraea sp. NPDC050556 TaxID=3364369 RepID=UPI0037B88CD1